MTEKQPISESNSPQLYDLVFPIKDFLISAIKEALSDNIIAKNLHQNTNYSKRTKSGMRNDFMRRALRKLAYNNSLFQEVFISNNGFFILSTSGILIRAKKMNARTYETSNIPTLIQKKLQREPSLFGDDQNTIQGLISVGYILDSFGMPNKIVIAEHNSQGKLKWCIETEFNDGNSSSYVQTETNFPPTAPKSTGALSKLTKTPSAKTKKTTIIPPQPFRLKTKDKDDENKSKDA